MSRALPSIFISTDDFNKLSNLVHSFRNDTGEQLEEELARATVADMDKIPFKVVSMNSTVRFRDLDSGKESEMTLVYPENANVSDGKISILAPIGVALIGLKLGQKIDWPVPGGQMRRLEVVAIV